MVYKYTGGHITSHIEGFTKQGTLLQYKALACVMVMWSPGETGEFTPATPVSSHTKTTLTRTVLSTAMICMYFIITCFVVVVK